jgi:hypothetical protein
MSHSPLPAWSVPRICCNSCVHSTIGELSQALRLCVSTRSHLHGK